MIGYVILGSAAYFFIASGVWTELTNRTPEWFAKVSAAGWPFYLLISVGQWIGRR
jgi:hypothetical protein